MSHDNARQLALISGTRQERIEDGSWRRQIHGHEPTSSLLDLLPRRHATEPVEKHGSSNVESDIHPEQTEVSPACVPVRIDALQELIGVVHLAVLTPASRLGIAKVAAGHGYIVVHIFNA